MPILREEVVRAARLARLALADDELDRLASELSSIVDYVSVLSEAAGDAHELVLAPADVVRPDEVGTTLRQDEALANAPRVRDGAFEVPGFLPDASGEGAE